MTPSEKIETACGWFHRVELDTSRIPNVVLIAICDKFGRQASPDRTALEKAVNELKTTQP